VSSHAYRLEVRVACSTGLAGVSLLGLEPLPGPVAGTSGRAQRSDCTHILGCVERLSRVELAWETLPVALRAMQAIAPEWCADVNPAVFQEAYAERHSDWHLSQEEVKAEMQKAGRDGLWLLDRLDDRAPERILALPEVVTLRMVWEQQFEWWEDTKRVHCAETADQRQRHCRIFPRSRRSVG
jgi:hypothetical protein